MCQALRQEVAWLFWRATRKYQWPSEWEEEREGIKGCMRVACCSGWDSNSDAPNYGPFQSPHWLPSSNTILLHKAELAISYCGDAGPGRVFHAAHMLSLVVAGRGSRQERLELHVTLSVSWRHFSIPLYLAWEKGISSFLPSSFLPIPLYHTTSQFSVILNLLYSWEVSRALTELC